MNQGAGAWKVAARAAAILQLILTGAVVFIVNDLQNIHDQIIDVSTEQARRESRITELESFKSRLENTTRTGKL